MEHLAFRLFRSRNEIVLTMERSFSSVGRKHVQPTNGRRREPASLSVPPPALLTKWQPESLSFLKHIPLFPPKPLKARGAGRKTENIVYPEQRAVSIFSREIILEKLHYGHQFKVAEGLVIHKDFQQ